MPRLATASRAARVMRSLRLFKSALLTVHRLFDTFALCFSGVVNVVHIVAHVLNSNFQSALCQRIGDPYSPRIAALARKVVVVGLKWICQGFQALLGGHFGALQAFVIERKGQCGILRMLLF